MKMLYITNLTPEVETDQLRELFSEHGDVGAVEFGSYEVPVKDGVQVICYALLEMGSEKTANRAMHSLNGHELQGRRLAISPAELGGLMSLTSKQRKVAAQIAETLNETEDKPLRMINAIVMGCGASFATALMEEALQIEEQGGMLRYDGERRTPGGIFFYLARHRMARPQRVFVYNRKGKLPQPEQESES